MEIWIAVPGTLALAACLFFAVQRLRARSRGVDVFVERCRAILEALHESDEIEYMEEEFAFQLTSGQGDRGPLRVHLHNAWRVWRHASLRTRDTELRCFLAISLAASGFELPRDFAEARSNVLPRVRCRSYLNEIRLHAVAEGRCGAMDDPRSISLVPSAGRLPSHLMVELVYDLPDSVVSLHRDTVAEWGIEPETLFDVAEQNLRIRRTNPTCFEPAGEGLFASTWNDSYDVSRILYPEVLRRLDVEGAPVAIPFSRDHLLVTGSESEAGLLAAAELMESHLETERVESVVPLVLADDDTWAVYEPPKQSEVEEALASVRKRVDVGNYDRQREWLERFHAESGDDVFVASVMGFEDDESGRLRTLSTWTRGVATLLPRTDLLAFFDPETGAADPEPLVVEWEKAAPIVRVLMTQIPLHPVRFRVEEFPAGDALRRLREVAV